MMNNKIEYELLSTKRGVLKNRQPFYLENNGCLVLSFEGLPELYSVARLGDKRGVFASLPICGALVTVPVPRLKAGAVNVEVICFKDDKPEARYVCEPFEVRNLGEQCSREYEVAPEYDKLAERVDFLERNDAETKGELSRLWEAIRDLVERDASKQELIASLIKAYNNPMG